MNNAPTSLIENDPHDFLENNVVLTVPLLLHHMLFLGSRINRLLQEITISTGALSGLRQFLAVESSIKITKNGFRSSLKALFINKTIKFLP